MPATLLRYPKQWLKRYPIGQKVDVLEILKLSRPFQLQLHSHKENGECAYIIYLTKV